MTENPATRRQAESPPGGMLCPVCGVDLVTADRQGVEIDYCPKCRGVWLDRGEIDKIIERSLDSDAARGDQPATPDPYRGAPQGYPPPRGAMGGDHGDKRHGGGHGDSQDAYARRSWLKHLFD